MELNTSSLIDFLAELNSIQDIAIFMERTLGAALQLAHAQSGLIVLFDYEEGQEVGPDVGLLRRYLAGQIAHTRATFQKLGLPQPSANPLGMWLPKTNALNELPASLQFEAQVLTVPLLAFNDGRPLGFVLLLLPNSKVSLKPSDHPTLNAFSRAVSNSWLNLRAFKSVSQRVDELSRLAELTATLNANRDLPELLQQIMQTTAQLLGAEACTLMLLDRQTNELVFQVADMSDNHKLREFRQSVEQGICGYVARIGKPTIVNDVELDSRFNQRVDHSTGFRTRSVLCVPMLVRDETMGVIEAINKIEGEFGNNDMALLLTLAAQAAIAIENAQLYADLTTERDKLLAKEEEVRRDLGRDLHDGPAQVISGMALRIELIKRLLNNQPSPALRELDELERVVLNTAKDIRTMMFGLRPLMLETKGLIPTLEAYVEKLQSEAWQTHLVVAGFQLAGGEYRRLAHNVENAFFIIIQEAINNIRKHAAPRNVWLRLTYKEQETVVVIQDDGKGFDVEAVTKQYEERTSFGLLNMRERARLINASFYMNSQPGQGTTITMTLRLQTNRLRPITGPLAHNLNQLSL